MHIAKCVIALPATLLPIGLLDRCLISFVQSPLCVYVCVTLPANRYSSHHPP